MTDETQSGQQLPSIPENLEKRLAALETLNAVSQAVSGQTELKDLYKTIHQEVSRILGDISFLIALYDAVQNTIEIPYMYEEGSVTRLDPFPLGEGITSILIKTRKPLMVVEDTDRRLKELGAKIIGAPAKSWLGVPLLVAGDVIGAMVVQDIEHEHRFDEDDQQLMTTLASQVAVTVRNARLLEISQRRTERERLLNQISSKLRSSTDINAILATTADELCKALGARRVHIKISPTSLDSHQDN